jgi:hypothetical protein
MLNLVVSKVTGRLQKLNECLFFYCWCFADGATHGLKICCFVLRVVLKILLDAICANSALMGSDGGIMRADVRCFV